jgi:hypothetical protein
MSSSSLYGNDFDFRKFPSLTEPYSTITYTTIRATGSDIAPFALLAYCKQYNNKSKPNKE